MTHRNDPAIDDPGFATLSVASILAESAQRHAERPALVFAGATTTYGELWDEVRAYAGALRARGIGPGDRVAMIVPNVPDFARVYYAALALGAVVVPVHLLFKAEEIAYVLRDAEADIFVVAAPLLGEAMPAAAATGIPVVTVLLPAGMPAPVGDLPRLEQEAAAAEPIARHAGTRPSDPATILYTSGTTGTPKGAVGSHLALVEQVHCTLIDSFNLHSGDIVFGGLPLFHTFGQTAVMNMAFRVGAAIILLPRFDADEALALMVTHGATVFTAVPTMYVGMLEAARRSDVRPPLRYAVSGGAALPVAVLEAFRDTFGADVHEGYGLTETAPIVSSNSLVEPIRPGTVGRPLWGVDVAIADPDVDERITLLTDPEALGEVVVRGHNLFKGYLGRPEATEAAIVDGWFRTGDLGRLIDGVLTIVDRKKDMIVRSGYNVYPTEVEAVIARHPGVAVAAVFGVADDLRGQEVHVAVVPHDGHSVDADELIAFTRERIAAYKYPRVVHLVAELPLGGSGKVLKRELVARYSPVPSATAAAVVPDAGVRPIA
ncbi:AMP-binding protein [Microbacterium sp. zg.Y1090]|uniref:AMP-binding protein n=1 Tax=Microbacterium TaxID=33882 RepID=UPI00214A9A7B|nr:MULTISPECIES: AMP-binding protein [unclassified Microbacterium]MCR2813167.1 AMP-binding protein [Microbacterium sp. zg.Y1084]MCR2819480.1 AMP-binding protein [Microbacterium sp. zg.Y1090]MDL5487334.1 AMP-binding protein [Microbacterium sp. zg-Y1211]WIM28453.1 AMP-binding protein [Microbacterium sp. zg-Y1090]